MQEKTNTSTRYRVLNAVFLVGIFTAFSSGLVNFILDLDPVVIITSFACGLLTIGLYVAFIISNNYKLFSMIAVIFTSFIIFPALWLITGGTHGSIPYYIILNAGVIALLLDGLMMKRPELRVS